jgi:hypothetical protein
MLSVDDTIRGFCAELGIEAPVWWGNRLKKNWCLN